MKIQPCKFSLTFEQYTPESAEDGEPSDSGFEWEGVAYTVRELADLIMDKGLFYWSDSDKSDWLYSEHEIIAYATMETESFALHPCNARSARYMRKAWEHVAQRLKLRG